MAQITSVTSEALQAEIRKLLPSQQGFGEDLQASNVIVPIVDLSTVASGTATPEFLAQAQNLGGSTAFNVQGTLTTIINTAGFFRIRANFWVNFTVGAVLRITDGVTTKILFDGKSVSNGGTSLPYYYDAIVYLNSGESVTLQGATGFNNTGNTQQIADVNGNVTLPTGFTPQ